jgi:hypothetical protein
MSKEKLKQLLEEKYSQVKVIYINYCYNIDDMVKFAAELTKLYRQLGIYKNKRDKFLKENNKTFTDFMANPGIFPDPVIKVGLIRKKVLNYASLSQEILQVQQKLTDYEARLNRMEDKDSLFAGKAFIMFNKPVDRLIVLNDNKLTVFGRIIKTIARKLCCCCSRHDLTSIIFSPAAEPTDVYWEHLDTSDFTKVKNTLFTYLVSLILVGACFGIIYGLTISKINYVSSHKTDTSTAAYVATNVLSIAISLVITIINQSLRTVVRKLSLYEESETITTYNLSVALKLTLVRFVNTAIVPLVVNIKLSQWFDEGGLVTNIFYIFLSICFLDSFM